MIKTPSFLFLTLLAFLTRSSSFTFTCPTCRALRTCLFYKNDTQMDESIETGLTLNLENNLCAVQRERLKKELALAAIENYDVSDHSEGVTSVAEGIMKQLEPFRPWEKPAHHPDLNARWSFVFTGVPTIGMKLITLLSRICVGFPPIDFCDVFLEVSKRQTQVKAIVSIKIFTVPLELHVFTALAPNHSDPHGTHLIESFQSIHLAGVEIPTPDSWRKSRDLEISYLDRDMMIARTAGGEPHFLLRHSPCSTDDMECDIDNAVTEYFEEARSKYGQQMSRSLVDRAYGDDSVPNANVGELVKSILLQKGGH